MTMMHPNILLKIRSVAFKNFELTEYEVLSARLNHTLHKSI